MPTHVKPWEYSKWMLHWNARSLSEQARRRKSRTRPRLCRLCAAESGGICTFCGAKVALNYSEQSETRPAHRASTAAKGACEAKPPPSPF